MISRFNGFRDEQKQKKKRTCAEKSNLVLKQKQEKFPQLEWHKAKSSQKMGELHIYLNANAQNKNERHILNIIEKKE